MSRLGGTIRADAARRVRELQKEWVEEMRALRRRVKLPDLTSRDKPEPAWNDINAFILDGDEEAIRRLIEISGGEEPNWERLFRVWFEGRPGYTPEDWLTLLACAVYVMPPAPREETGGQ